MIPILIRFASESDPCEEKKFFFLNTWYHYFVTGGFSGRDALNRCVFNLPDAISQSPNAYWLIAMGILDILLRVAGFIAVVMVLYAGVQYVTSNGDPSNAQAAKNTIINAMIGLVITVVASALVNFVANKFLI